MSIRKYFDDFYMEVYDESNSLIIRYRHETLDGTEKNEKMVKQPIDFNTQRRLEDEVDELRSKKEVSKDQLEELGNHLFEMLFPADVNSAFERALELVTGDPERGLRVVIAYPEHSRVLAHLPLELLRCPASSGIWLATDPRLTLSRKFLFSSAKYRGRQKRPSLKVLLVVGNVQGENPVMSGQVLQSMLKWAVGQKQAGGEDVLVQRPTSRTSAPVMYSREETAEIMLKVLGRIPQVDFPIDTLGEVYLNRRASIEEFQEILDDWKPQVLHFICHGRVEDKEGQLAFVDSVTGKAEWVDADVLARYLQPVEPWLRLIVLQSCESASSQLSLASRLVNLNIPAVVAMQYEIENQCAVTFATGFYEALAKKADVDYAVQLARKGITAMPDPVTGRKLYWNKREFCTPALYTFNPGTTIIDSTSDSLLQSLRQLQETQKELQKMGRTEEERMIGEAIQKLQATDQISTLYRPPSDKRVIPG